MTLYIDDPLWPAHGTRWSHLISDTSLAELHDFAGSVGIPARAFDGDHYDVPEDRRGDLVDAGAADVGTRQLVRILIASGLRAPRPRSAKVRYRARRLALAAVIIGPVAGPAAPPGYDAAIGAASLDDALRRAAELDPALDAVVAVPCGDDATERLDRVYLESSRIDGRSRYRHPAGALVLGRVHWTSHDHEFERLMMSTPRDVSIRDTAIKLGQLLKLAGLVEDGVQAKMLLSDGEVTVNGSGEDRRGRQVHPGDIVDAAGEAVRVVRE